MAFVAARPAATTRSAPSASRISGHGAVVEVDHLHGPRAGALDEAVLFQAAERLADRRGADGQPLGQPALGDLLPRLQLARHDRLADRAVRLVGQRRAVELMQRVLAEDISAAAYLL